MSWFWFPVLQYFFLEKVYDNAINALDIKSHQDYTIIEHKTKNRINSKTKLNLSPVVSAFPNEYILIG